MTDVTRAALLPCPFCSTSAYVSFHGADRARVKCLESDCGAEVSAYSKPSAIEKWNRRAALAAAPESGLTDEREKFEKWAEANNFTIHRDESDKYRDYHRATTRFAWEAWQARAALSTATSLSPSPPAGWKLVPIEATAAMIDAVENREDHLWSTSSVWRAMLAVSPQVSEPAK